MSSNVSTTLKIYLKKKAVGLYSKMEKPSIWVQFKEQEVKKLHVEQEQHLQESALWGLLTIISNFINVTFWGTEFNFLIIKSSKINEIIHYFYQAGNCYSKYI